MAEFFVRVLKWLAALVVAYFLLFILAFFVIIGIGVAFQPPVKSVDPGSILVLDLGFNLTDQPGSDDPAQLIRSALQGDLIESASLRQVLETLNDAAADSDISGLLIKGNLLVDGYGGSYAALREVRQAILSFRKSKPVWAYLDMDSLRDLYMKSAATEVFCNPGSMADFRGLRGERLYFGEAFEKIGVEVQVEAFEEYKSAAESYQRGSMSPEERVQLDSLLNELWDVIVGDIAEARDISVEALDDIAGKELILMDEEIVSAGLADDLLEEDELIEALTGIAGYDAENDTFQQFDFMDYMDLQVPAMPVLDLDRSSNRIGIVYIEGILIDGEGQDSYVGSDRLIRYLREMRKSDSVKAVVLRINSPGGSATASGKVVREIERLNSEKPVVVSMGGIAASAGYMMAAAGEEIYSQPLTITGSIGVVIMLPNIEALASKLSISFEGVETHPFAGTFSIGRRKTDEEMRQIREMGATFYSEFLDLVAAKRDLPYARVREIGRGRVWSGSAALEHDLVDKLGGLAEATRRAADLAGIGDDFEVLERPRWRSLEEQISEWLVDARIQYQPKSMNPSLMSTFKEVEEEFRMLSLLNDPYGQYAILPYTLKLR